VRVVLQPGYGKPRRLDVALVEALAEAGQPCSRNQLARAFADGGVTIAGAAVKPKLKVDRELEVDVELSPPEPLRAQPDDIPLSILHEDEALMVIDKPAGLVMHPGPGHATGTLVGAVLHHLGVEPDALPILPGNDATRPGIVHRLDKDTSGVVVVAKTARAQTALAEQFSTHDIERVYWALVDRLPQWSKRTIRTGHAREPGDRRRFSPTHGGRTAITQLTIVERFAVPAAIIEATLQTGRTHQIRMHARHVGHPVLGDPLYGFAPNHETVRGVAETLGRTALHARVLGFLHPDGRRLRFESDPPPELQQAAKRLAEAD